MPQNGVTYSKTLFLVDEHHHIETLFKKRENGGRIEEIRKLYIWEVKKLPELLVYFAILFYLYERVHDLYS